MGLLIDDEPVEVEIFTKDRKTGKMVKNTVQIREFGEQDVARRSKFIQQPDSTEDSRRGRGRRGQSNFHIERVRYFNFLHGIVDWDFTFPEDYYSKDEGRRIPHPKAGKKMPRTREIFDRLPEAVMDKIQEGIDDLNEALEPSENKTQQMDSEGNPMFDEDGEPIMRDKTEEEKEADLPPSEENSEGRSDTGSTTPQPADQQTSQREELPS